MCLLHQFFCCWFDSLSDEVCSTHMALRSYCEWVFDQVLCAIAATIELKREKLSDLVSSNFAESNKENSFI